MADVVWRWVMLFAVVSCTTEDYAREEHGVYYPTECEVCKYSMLEVMAKLDETGKTHEVLETGASFDGKKKRKKYAKSELRLLETLENVCERILEYNIHKERTDSTRFAKGMSQTFATLHGLVNKGVKVDLGMPEELWDKPSAEITMLKTKCESLLEVHDDDIRDWYFNYQETKSLVDYICVEKALKKGDDGCLWEGLHKEKQSESKQEL